MAEKKKETKSFEYKEKEPKQKKVAKQDEKYDALYNQFLRLQADFDNYKKRNATLSTNMYNDGINDAMMAILPTIDSIDMAINAQTDENQKKGIELIKKAFMETLAKFEIEEIKAEGEEFDPNFHEAVMSRDDAENAGKVIQVLRAGYKRKDKVLRHTMCVVGQ